MFTTAKVNRSYRWWKATVLLFKQQKQVSNCFSVKLWNYYFWWHSELYNINQTQHNANNKQQKQNNT